MSSLHDRLSITDISGRIVWNQNESLSQTYPIDLSTYESGIYLLEIISKGERGVKKLIKH
tara:strand:- start:1817 stop:1996 length:180 start_codon:yes stop_codon:yes gene_type:complete